MKVYVFFVGKGERLVFMRVVDVKEVWNFGVGGI